MPPQCQPPDSRPHAWSGGTAFPSARTLPTESTYKTLQLLRRSFLASLAFGSLPRFSRDQARRVNNGPRLLSCASNCKRILACSLGRSTRPSCSLHQFDPIHRILARFEVRAHQQFTDEPDGQYLHSEEAEHHSQNQQRPVFHKDRFLPHYFFQHQDQHDCPTRKQPEQSRRPEEMQWPGHVAHQEANRNNVEENADRPRNSIV